MARTSNGTTDDIVVSTINDCVRNIILLWVRPTTLPASTDRDIILGFNENGTPGTYDKTIYIRSTGIFKFRIYDGATKQVASTSGMSTNTWYCIGAKTDGTNIHAYFNGTDEATTAAGDSFNFTNPDLGILNDNLGGGTLSDGESSRTILNGNFAYVCIWDNENAISTNMIAAMARGVNPIGFGMGSNMIYFAPFEGNDSTEPDYARSDGNGTGSLTGTTKFSGNPPVELLENYL